MFFPVIASEHSERGNLSVHILYAAIFQAFTMLKLAEILRFALNDNKQFVLAQTSFYRRRYGRAAFSTGFSML